MSLRGIVRTTGSISLTSHQANKCWPTSTVIKCWKRIITWKGSSVRQKASPRAEAVQTLRKIFRLTSLYYKYKLSSGESKACDVLRINICTTNLSHTKALEERKKCPFLLIKANKPIYPCFYCPTKSPSFNNKKYIEKKIKRYQRF